MRFGPRLWCSGTRHESALGCGGSTVSAVSGVRRVFIVLVCAVVVLGGCRVDSEISIDIDVDGSGTVAMLVTIEADAAARVPELAPVMVGDTEVDSVAGLKVDDLEAAGWTVSAPQIGPEGDVSYDVIKHFVSAAQLESVLGELAGPGVFSGTTLERDRTFARTTWDFGTNVDLSQQVAMFSDPEIAALLQGQAFGRDVAGLEAELGAPLATLVNLSISVTMPDSIDESNAPLITGSTSRWDFSLADLGPHALTASSLTNHREPVIWAVIAVASLVALILVGIYSWLRRWASRR